MPSLFKQEELKASIDKHFLGVAQAFPTIDPVNEALAILVQIA
jgi:hypothetical protein